MANLQQLNNRKLLKRRNLALALLAALLTEAPSAARNEPHALAALTACRAIQDAGQRLACYDREVATIDTAAKNDKLVVLDQEQVRQTRRTLFGFALPRINLFGSNNQDRASADELNEIESSIVQIDRLSDGRASFTIEGGAGWVQTDDRFISFARVTKGSKVKISRGALGSYFAEFARGGSARVRRDR